MRNYYRIMLGKKSAHAADCFGGGYIAAGFMASKDLTRRLPESWRDFNREFIPLYLEKHPEKSKISAGLACGALWTIAKGIKHGDYVLCPDGQGAYRVGEVTSEYFYTHGQVLPHRRKVRWLEQPIERSRMSEALQHSSGSIGTVSDISSYREELERLIQERPAPSTSSGEDVIEDPVAFAMEKHLEAFLVENWNQTELSKEFSIYEEEGESVGQQYATDAGPIDILAISRDKKRLVVVELKRGRATDVVVGQTLRYMGYVKEQIAEPDQTVLGAIIALEDDQKLRWALAAVPSITFYRYQVNFKLVKA